MADMIAEEGRFAIHDQDMTQAEVTYSSQGEGTISIDHTYVDPKFRGQGLAGKLIQEVIQHARENHLKIIPACAYAQHHFETHPQDQDVLHS
ncbi:GNAT family N-acetyltransferase [Paenibacillus sp. JSM ZJ436]|uniref:GNAT family N-acetyltransferase n=1 Tax=Paenibacillus sp. JSM ZJ436 TaxID=3376190 RepID=UPI0037AD0C4F